MKLFGFSRKTNAPQWSELRESFDRDGFAVLPGFFAAEMCDRMRGEVELYTRGRQFPASRITIDILHGAHAGRRVFVRDAPDEAFEGPFKINHLFTESAPIADSVFDARLRGALHSLIDDEPVVINSLNFRHGSQQPAHIDTWYMPPPKRNSLIVASISLEDVREDAGPLFYYPGSHHIPPFTFSHGGIHAVNEEIPKCWDYLEKEIAARGLKKETFLGKKGDVFLWHAQLLHGGTPIADPAKTRSSLVVHYWGAAAARGRPLASTASGGKYLDRDYWETDGKPIESTRPAGSTPAQPEATQTKANGVPAMTIAPASSSHAAFETWEARGEALESVEARIHDGATREQLHGRAESYLRIFEKLFPNTAPAKAARMLEIGSGVGYVMEAALRRYAPAKIIGLDVAQGMIEMARRRLQRDGVDNAGVEFVHYDGVDAPLASESLDFIYSVASLQHAPRPYCFRAISEAHRLLRSDGTAWIHLLGYTHFSEHMNPQLFQQEMLVQIRGLQGHWHHYYSMEELEAVLHQGIGVKREDFKIREREGSLYICFKKR
jgi:phytanoyl-CoA hydroxylase